MSDPTTDTLRRTMQAIVAAAPEAPELETELESAPTRQPRPVLVMAGAFAFVLLIGAVTSLLLLSNDRGTVPSGGAGDGIAVTTSVLPAEPIVYDVLPTTWDVVVVVDVDDLERDPAGISRFVEQAGGVPGVESISVVSPDDLATALGWEDGSGGGIFIVTGGDASAAEQAALLAPDGWKIVLTAQRREEAMRAAIERMQRYSERVTDQLSLGTFSGPEPAFDTTSLGDEMPLVNAYDGADTLPQVPDAFGELSDAIVYIGSIDAVDGFVYGVSTDGGTIEICQAAAWTASNAAMNACFMPDEQPGLWKSVGMADSAADGIAVNVTALGDEVSVVAIELPSGQQYWQRPVAGSAMFVTSEPGVLVGITITTYDESGAVLATEQFNPNA